MPRSIDDVAERLKSRTFIDAETGCHVWRGQMNPKGYGRLTVKIGEKHRHRPTHRLAYELAKGQIPSGLQIDHLCRNRACCNPDHLEAVTAAENVRRSMPFWSRGHGGPLATPASRRPRLFCKRGHALTPENTTIDRSWRRCNTCYPASGAEPGPVPILSSADVQTIRTEYRRGYSSRDVGNCRDLAARFGVDPRTIRAIASGEKRARDAAAIARAA